MEPRFLGYEEVVAIHEDQIRRYGGRAGLRDEGLLLSALAMPQAGSADEYLHADLAEMAAAYLFHLTGSHPFVDGNKRVGAVSARIFLALNGVTLEMPEEAAYDLVMTTAAGRMTKREIAAAFRQAARTKKERGLG